MKHRKQEVAYAFRKFEFEEQQGRINDLDAMIKKLLLTQNDLRSTIRQLEAEIKAKDKAVAEVEAKSEGAFAIIASLEKQLASQQTVIQELKVTQKQLEDGRDEDRAKIESQARHIAE